MAFLTKWLETNFVHGLTWHWNTQSLFSIFLHSYPIPFLQCLCFFIESIIALSRLSVQHLTRGMCWTWGSVHSPAWGFPRTPTEPGFCFYSQSGNATSKRRKQQPEDKPTWQPLTYALFPAELFTTYLTDTVKVNSERISVKLIK